MSKPRRKINRKDRTMARKAARLAGGRIPREALDMASALDAVYEKHDRGESDPTAVQPRPQPTQPAKPTLHDIGNGAAVILIAAIFTLFFLIIAALIHATI